jgi:hypothetical protein
MKNKYALGDRCQLTCISFERTNASSKPGDMTMINMTRRMKAAYKAGEAFWPRCKGGVTSDNIDVTPVNLAALARVYGWQGAETERWVAGFYDARFSALSADNAPYAGDYSLEAREALRIHGVRLPE